MKITLNMIKEKDPCANSWKELLRGLGKTKADDEELDVPMMFKTNKLENICWVLDKVLNMQKELRLFAYWNAKQCLKYIPDDEKEEYKKVINTVNLYVYKKVNGSALCSALCSAWDSALCSACFSAWDSARDSAWTTDLSCAWASAWSASRPSALKKSEQKLLEIINGKLPAMYKGTNHY